MAKIQPQNKIQVLPVEEDLNWCLDKLVNGWMRIIGIEPNIPEKKGYWRWIVWLIQRWTCFFLALGIIVYLLISPYLNRHGHGGCERAQLTSRRGRVSCCLLLLSWKMLLTASKCISSILFMPPPALTQLQSR